METKRRTGESRHDTRKQGVEIVCCDVVDKYVCWAKKEISWILSLLNARIIHPIGSTLVRRTLLRLHTRFAMSSIFYKNLLYRHRVTGLDHNELLTTPPFLHTKTYPRSCVIRERVRRGDRFHSIRLERVFSNPIPADTSLHHPSTRLTRFRVTCKGAIHNCVIRYNVCI